MASFLLTGRNDGVVHWRSSQAGPVIDQVLRTLTEIFPMKRFTETDLRALFSLGSLYGASGRLKDWNEVTSVQEVGFYLRIHTEPRRFEISDIRWDERTIFENDDFLIFNKPSALPCHPMVDNDQENLLSGLIQHRKIELLPTHRLDVATQGLLVIAKTPAFQSYFNTCLQNRSVQKIYWAKVEGAPAWKSGTELCHHMIISPRAPKQLQNSPGENTQECRLKILEVKNGSLLKIALLTGRTHQIRAQLSFEGFPIIGDVAYGANPMDQTPENIALQSYQLSFPDESLQSTWFFRVPLALEEFSKLTRPIQSK